MEDDLDIMERIDEFDFGFEIPDVCIEYEQNDDDDGCGGGACKI